MSIVRILDAGGDEFTIVDFGEFKSSLFGKTLEYIRDLNAKLPEFEFRDGDILLASYPKTGCTWTHEIVSMLLKGKAESPEHSKMRTMLEATASADFDVLSSPRLLNTHIPYSRIPNDLGRKKVKVVFILRNPKDAAVSYYNMMIGMKHYKYSGTFANWLPLYVEGRLAFIPYTDYLREWEKVYKAKKHEMMILYYEDLKKDTGKEVKRLAEFLGLSASEELVSEISEKCQFHEMKSRYTTNLMPGYYKDGKGYGFMRKGEVGNWKVWFTVAQSEMMDANVEEQLKDSIFKFTYQL